MAQSLKGAMIDGQRHPRCGAIADLTAMPGAHLGCLGALLPCFGFDIVVIVHTHKHPHSSSIASPASVYLSLHDVPGRGRIRRTPYVKIGILGICVLSFVYYYQAKEAGGKKQYNG
jgi:hypothetical protein